MGHHSAPSAADYDEDFYAWTQRQAKLLRTLNGLRSELPKELDVDHLAEEIEDLGKAELRSVTSLIRQILIHLIKAASEPDSQARGHWRTEATTFNLDIPGYYAPSMRQLIDMQAEWRRARKAAEVSLQEHGSDVAANVPAECPYSLDDMIAEDFDFDAALARLSSSVSSA
jgi:hypothetical protein